MKESKNPKLIYTIKKTSALILHIIALAVFVSGMSTLYCNENFKKGIAWLNSETYEESQSFVSQVNDDIDILYSYLQYRDLLEGSSGMDYECIMFSINDGPNRDMDYSVNDVISYAKAHGYSLDNDYSIISYPDSLSDSTLPVSKVLVNYRNYSEDDDLTEPGDAYATLDSLISDSLSCISKYYKGYHTFNEEPSNFKYMVQNDIGTYTNDNTLTPESINYGKYAIYNSSTHSLDTNLSSRPDNITLKNLSYGTDDDNYITAVAVDTTYAADDSYRTGQLDYAKQRNLYFTGLLMASIGILVMILSFIMLVYMSGKKVKRDTNHYTTSLDTLSVELAFLLCGVSIIILLYFNERIGTDLIHVYVPIEFWGFAGKMSACVLIYLVGLVFIFIPIRQFKSNVLWTNSSFKKIHDEIGIYKKKHSYTRLLVINYFSIILVNIFLVALAIIMLVSGKTLVNRFIVFGLVLILICVDIVVFHRLYKTEYQHELLSQAMEKIAGGDTTYQLNLDEFSGKNQAVANFVNHISQGLDKALGEQVRSERMKADLITNVSHDIKTPLTSIINYVDLMKREHPTDPKICEYLAVLDAKSQHLKTLTEDLVEASKASSGNIQMDMNPIDFVELVEQANGEFEERFDKKNLSLISSLPGKSITISADGNRLWRVLENIYSNICKYAADNSRVYIDMLETDTTITMTAKNVSANPLNISPDELTERFVRGDVSRSTEGSGLGLSIARSLTELQQGQFSIEIDGDLFKVSISFQKL